MPHRPYPNAERALNNLRRQQAVYLYGRFPQRYVLGFDLPNQVDRMVRHRRPVAARHAFPVDTYRLSTRRPAPAAPIGLRD